MRQRLGGLGMVVLGVVAVGNGGRKVLATRRVIICGSLAGNRVMQMPAIGPNRVRQTHCENGSQCQRERHASPFSETHGQSLTYLP